MKVQAQLRTFDVSLCLPRRVSRLSVHKLSSSLEYRAFAAQNNQDNIELEDHQQ